MDVVNNIENVEVKDTAKHNQSSELKVEIFKYFGTPRKSKTSKSPMKRNKKNPIVIIPQMRKTRLKSAVYVENLENVLPDGDYDISNEAFSSGHIETERTKTPPPKNGYSISESKPARRRSNRLKSEVLDRDCLSNLPDKEDVAASEPADKLGLERSKNNTDMNTSPNRKTTMMHRHKRQAKKRKTSDEEMAENFFDSINTDAIADMLLSTDTSISNELQNLSISKKQRTNTERSKNLLGNSPNKNYKYAKETNGNSNITPTENCNIQFENDNLISVPTTNHNETEKEKNSILRRIISSDNLATNNVTNDKNSQINGINKNLEKNCKTKSCNNNSILRYFKVQNKQQGNKKVQGNKTSKSHETITQCSKLNSDGNVSNNLSLTESNNHQNSNQMPTKRRSTQRLSAQDTSNQNSSQMPVKRGRGRPLSTIKRVNMKKVTKETGKKYTKLRKLTKQQIKHVNIRRIPEDHLNDVLAMINNEDHPIWNDHDRSCNPYIFQHWNQYALLSSDQNIKIKYARQFLLRRDWISLSRILGSFSATSRSYYPLVAKYATLLLAHTDKEQFNNFIQFLTKFNDSSAVMKACTTLPTGNDE